jgi:hypothetical protein
MLPIGIHKDQYSPTGIANTGLYGGTIAHIIRMFNQPQTLDPPHLFCGGVRCTVADHENLVVSPHRRQMRR